MRGGEHARCMRWINESLRANPKGGHYCTQHGYMQLAGELRRVFLLETNTWETMRRSHAEKLIRQGLARWVSNS